MSAFNLAAIQRALDDDGVDGWLLYDFHGSNPIAVSLTGLAGRHTTRRWYYWVPRRGAPQKLVHAIESGVLDALPGDRRLYAERHELAQALVDIVGGARTVAMEFSPNGAIPYVSRVDAGTVDFIRSLGPAVVSSGDLVGRFEAAWDAPAVASHREASAALYRIKDRTLEFVRGRLRAGVAVDEYTIQQQMLTWFGEERLTTDAGPIVAAQEHTGDPHYEPAPSHSRLFKKNELLLLDLWGKCQRPGAVYADITWMAFSGTPPPDVSARFALAAAARDAAVALVQERVSAGRPIRGWEVDRAARDIISAAGLGAAFIHRTGHSLGSDVHGNGVHMDDYETRDDRRLLEGTGFTIEPGIYAKEFGVRTEINMVVERTSAEVTGARQAAIDDVS